jgi:hypothetical protein
MSPHVIAPVVVAAASRDKTRAALKSAVEFSRMSLHVHDVESFGTFFALSRLNFVDRLENQNLFIKFQVISVISQFYLYMSSEDRSSVELFVAAIVSAEKFRFLVKNLMA